MRRLPCLLLLLCAAVACRRAGEGDAVIDIDRSSVVVDRSDNVLADGHDAATVTVALLDPHGAPLARHAFALNVTGSANSLDFSGSTDALGQASIHLRSTVAEVKVIYAGVGSQLVKTRVSTRFIAGPPSRLGFVVQPGQSRRGVAIAPAVSAAILDAQGNVCDAGPSIAVALAGGTAGAVLGGTRQRGAVHGQASFADLTVDQLGVSYTLTAHVDGLVDGSSTPFDVVAGATAQAVFTVQPSSALAGSAIAPAVVVALQDAGGQPVTSAATITVALGAGGSNATLGGTRARAAVRGSATFDDLRIDVAAPNYALVASSTGFSGVTSAPFEVRAGAPCQCNSQISASPTGVPADGTTPVTLAVVIHDDHGNPVPDQGVTFASSVGGDVLAPSVVGGILTDAYGRASVQLTGTLAGSRTVRASFGDVDLSITVTLAPTS